MSIAGSSILWTSRNSLGLFDVYESCEYQPINMGFGFSTVYPIANIVNNLEAFVSTYNTCSRYTPPFEGNQYESVVRERTHLGIYRLFDAYRDGAPVNKFYGQIERASTNISSWLESHPLIIDDNAYYVFEIFTYFDSKLEWFEIVESGGTTVPIVKPNYIDLLKGYSLDNRTIVNLPSINLQSDETCRIQYYQVNDLESIPGLKSIDWRTYQIDIKKNIQTKLPITGCVLGTLYIDNQIIRDQLLALPTVLNQYSCSDFFPESIPNLFTYWQSLIPPPPPPLPTPPPEATNIRLTLSTEVNRIVHTLPANNNIWNNRLSITNPVNTDLSHPMYIVDENRAYDWHLSQQIDGSTGTLIMDSARLIEIWFALGGSKFAINPVTNEPRVSNLGHLIEMISFLLGYRPEPDGTFNKQAEDARVRRVIPSGQKVDKTKLGVNNFGSAGMIIKRIINRFKGTNIVSDECVIVRDIPQLLSEFQEQINLSLGLQESGAIEINNEIGTSRYNNQLEVLIELVNTVKSNQEMLRAALNSSLVTQGQTSEIIGGLGLPSLTKTIPIVIDGKNNQLPYKGISPHRSISQEVATATYNIGLVLGQLI